MKQKLKADIIDITLTFDGWTNVLNQNILSLIFIILEGEVLIWKAIDISGESEKWKEVFDKTEIMFKEINDMQVNLIALVTDSASSYAAARYILYIFIYF